jgi:4-hydroxy-tetrahydrodipicolinate reductase
VIHFGTGYSGTHALRGIIDHPELELVALVVHNDEKVGRDAGELAGVASVGITATQDLDAALAKGADAFCYMATTHGRFKAAIGEVCSILESGTNVVTTSFGLLIHPGSARADVRQRLDDAAHRGGASFLSTGIEPGFFSDYLPVVLSGCAHRIDMLRVYELAVYQSGHQSDQVAFEICGFGKPVDTAPPIVDPAGMLQWAGVVRSMAEQLAVPLDDVATSHELLPAPESFDYQGRRIEAGTIAGFRFEIAGMSDGRKKVAVEHVTRTRADQAPDWPSSASGDVYRVELDGSPRLECEFAFREGDDHLAGGFNITAMRAVNAIPALCAADPGVRSTFDLPPVTGRGRFA